MARRRRVETKLDEIKQKKQLLVEGKDQQNFFEALITHLSLSDIQVQNYGSVNGLRSFLMVLVKARDFASVSSIGIARDAEVSARAAFESVQGALGKAGLFVPAKVGEREGGNPDVSVLILPEDDEPGMLETLLCRTLEGMKVNRCIDDFFECAEGLPDVSIDKPDKARAFAYLTTRPDPHHSVGVAAKNGVWDLDHQAFDEARDFLRAL